MVWLWVFFLFVWCSVDDFVEVSCEYGVVFVVVWIDDLEVVVVLVCDFGV